MAFIRLRGLRATKEVLSSILNWVCPQCGGRRRLAEVIPDLHDNPEMRYRCTCGFHYSMSARGTECKLVRCSRC